MRVKTMSYPSNHIFLAHTIHTAHRNAYHLDKQRPLRENQVACLDILRGEDTQPAMRSLSHRKDDLRRVDDR